MDGLIDLYLSSWSRTGDWTESLLNRIVRAMGKTYVLDRVAADLARGLTHPAIQRLSSLVAAYPTDLDLRRRLAAVHRRVGNRIQAGRWDYLTIGADAADTRAFERAFPSAVARLRAVHWPHRASAAATSYARSRLTKLVAAAEAETRPAGVNRSASVARRTDDVTRWRAARAWWRASISRVWSALPAPAARVAGRLSRLELRSIPVAVAATVTVGLIAVGVVTVIEWIVL